jgi:hypothetical protein
LAWISYNQQGATHHARTRPEAQRRAQHEA